MNDTNTLPTAGDSLLSDDARKQLLAGLNMATVITKAAHGDRGKYRPNAAEVAADMNCALCMMVYGLALQVAHSAACITDHMDSIQKDMRQG